MSDPSLRKGVKRERERVDYTSALCRAISERMLPLSYLRAGAGRNAPKSVGSLVVFPGDVHKSFFQDVVHKARVTDISNFITVMCYIWFIHPFF